MIDRPRRTVIVGSGPSLRGVDLHIPEGIHVIAVNQAIRHIPRTDAWFTMDPDESNQLILANPRPGVRYFAAVWESYVRRELRMMKHITFLRRIDGPPESPAHALPGLSEDRGAIHAGGSMWGALQLEYHSVRSSQQEPDAGHKLALLGLDGHGGYAWSNGHPGDLSHLPMLFRSAVGQIKRAGIRVVNGSPDSTVTCWARVTPQEAIGWVSE